MMIGAVIGKMQITHNIRSKEMLETYLSALKEISKCGTCELEYFNAMFAEIYAMEIKSWKERIDRNHIDRVTEQLGFFYDEETKQFIVEDLGQ